MNGKNFAQLTLTLPLMLMLFACSDIDKLRKKINIEKPAVSLSEVKLIAISLTKVDLAIGLAVDNPNPVAIELAGFDYKLVIEGNDFIKGTKNEPVNIEAAKEKIIFVPVSFAFADVKKLSDSLVNKDEFNYEINAVAHIKLPVLGVQKFPSSIKGTLPVPQLPRLSIKHLTVQNLSLASVTLRLSLEIENPNIFGLDFSHIDYNLSVDGKQWLRSSLTQPIRLKSKDRTTLDIPLQLNLLQMGETLYQSLDQARPLPYKLKGNMRFNTSLPALKGTKAPFEYSGVIAPN